MNLIPNIPPKLFSLSAVAVGYILIDDLTANEQVQTDRGNDSPSTHQPSTEETIVMMQKMIQTLQTKINSIKQEMNK